MGFHRGVIASPQNRDPDAPTNLTVTQGNQSFNLSWSSPYADPLAVNITDYRIQYKTEAGGAITWATIPDGVSMNTTATLSNSGGSYFTTGTSYVFRVAAIIGGSLQGLYSAASTARVFAGAPGKVAKPTVEFGNGVGVNFRWTRPAENGSAILSYNVQLSVSGGPFTDWKVFDNGENDVVGANPATGVTILTPGTSYRFRVSATNSVGTGEISDPSDSFVFATLPAWPSSPTVVSGDCEVTINWPAVTANGNTITGYRLYVAYSPAGGVYGGYVDYGLQSSGYQIQHRNDGSQFMVYLTVEHNLPNGITGTPVYSSASNSAGPVFPSMDGPTATLQDGYPKLSEKLMRPATVSFTAIARNVSPAAGRVILVGRTGTSGDWVGLAAYDSPGSRTENISSIGGWGLVSRGTYQFCFFIENSYGDVYQSPVTTYVGSAGVEYITEFVSPTVTILTSPVRTARSASGGWVTLTALSAGVDSRLAYITVHTASCDWSGIGQSGAAGNTWIQSSIRYLEMRVNRTGLTANRFDCRTSTLGYGTTAGLASVNAFTSQNFNVTSPQFGVDSEVQFQSFGSFSGGAEEDIRFYVEAVYQTRTFEQAYY